MDPGEMVEQRWKRQGQETNQEMRSVEREGSQGGWRWKHETGITPDAETKCRRSRNKPGYADAHSTGVAVSDAEKKDWPNTEKKGKKMEPGEMVEQRWKK
jgi:hypothetical protein